MALRELDTILLKEKTGVNAFSENIYSPPISVTARWNDEQKLINDEKGTEFAAQSTLYYLDPNKFKVGDSVKINGTPDDFKVIRAIEKYRNGSGTRKFNIAYLDNANR